MHKNRRTHSRVALGACRLLRWSDCLPTTATLMTLPARPCEPLTFRSSTHGRTAAPTSGVALGACRLLRWSDCRPTTATLVTLPARPCATFNECNKFLYVAKRKAVRRPMRERRLW